VIEIEKSNRKSKGGRSTARLASKTAQSRQISPRSPSAAICAALGCTNPLVGRQKRWCAEHRSSSGRSRASVDANVDVPPALIGAPDGHRDPAHRLIPEAVDGSRAPEAIELGREADLQLDGWQEDVLAAGMATAGGRWASDEVVFVVPRQNGKTALMVLRALWGVVLGGERLAVYTAHEFKTCREAFLLAKSLVETEVFEQYEPKVSVSHGKEGISFSNGHRLLFIARSRTSGRGFSPDVVFLDESFELDDLALAALKPSVSAAVSSQLWFASSAPHDTSSVLRRLALVGRAGDADRMTYLEWCADPDRPPGDIEGWKEANPALGSRLALQTIASELEIMTPEDFGRERLGHWRQEEVVGVFDGALWASLAVQDPLTPGSGSAKALAIDVSPARDRAAIAAAARLDDGRTLIEVIADEPGTSWLPDRVKEIVDEHHPGRVLLDAVGPGQSLVPKFQELGIQLTTTDTAAMTAACAGFFDAVVQGNVMHRDDPVLNAAVAGAKQRELGDRWAWARRTSRSNVSPLVSVTLAHYGVTVLGSGGFWAL
jgi:phage terminase large subunit-like protein